MTQLFPLQVNPSTPPQFSPILDGQSYTCIVTWNLSAQRYYINLYALTGALVLSRALVGSDVGIDIQSISFDLEQKMVTVLCAKPHRLRIGNTIDLTISNVSPATYNGRHRCLVIDDLNLTYPSSVDPGEVAALGAIGYVIDLVEGYFDESTMIFREASQTFEVT